MQNLVSLFGMFVLIFGAFCLSEDRRRFPWRVVIWGLALQLLFGFRTLDELEATFPDCIVRTPDARVLLAALFPKLPSDVWPVV